MLALQAIASNVLCFVTGVTLLGPAGCYVCMYVCMSTSINTQVSLWNATSSKTTQLPLLCVCPYSEVVETACGIATMMMGETVENVAAGIDCYSLRQPLGVRVLKVLCSGSAAATGASCASMFVTCTDDDC